MDTEQNETILPEGGSKGSSRYHRRLFLLCSAGYFIACAELLVIVFLITPFRKEWSVSTRQFVLAPFFGSVANMLGGLFFGLAADSRGRRTPFAVSLLVVAVFSIASAFSPSYPIFLFLRAINSVGLGGLSVIDFVLLFEVVPARRRGFYMIGVTTAGTLGVLFVATVAWISLSFANWRIFLLCSAVPSILLCPFSGIIRENDNACGHSSSRETSADLTCRKNTRLIMKDAVRQQAPSYSNGIEYRTSYKNQEKHMSSWALWPVWFFHSFSYWGMTTFLPRFLHRNGLKEYSLIFFMVATELPGLALSSIVIDSPTAGRLPLLRAGLLGAVCASVSLTISTALRKSWLLWISACAVYLFTTSIFAVLFTYTMESYASGTRSKAFGVGNALAALPGVLAPLLSAKLVEEEESWVFPGIWACTFALASIFSWCLHRETRNMDLRALEDTEPRCEENAGQSEMQHLLGEPRG